MTQADSPRDRLPAQSAADDLLNAPAPHRAADDTEEIYFEGSPLFRAELVRLALWWLLGILLIGGAIVLLMLGLIVTTWWISIPMIALGLLAILIPVLQIKSLRYRITNYRIDYERGLLTKKIDTLELWHVDDISYEQGIIGRMFGVGSIKVISDDKTTPELTMHGIPRPRFVFDSLKQRIIAVKRQRGVIKMDSGD